MLVDLYSKNPNEKGIRSQKRKFVKFKSSYSCFIEVNGDYFLVNCCPRYSEFGVRKPN